MRLKTTNKMTIDADRLSWVYHVIYLIKELLLYVSTWVLHRPAELAGRALYNLVYDAGCIFEPAQIFPDGKYILFEFLGCPGI
jgi:hypothetical protein